MARKLGVALAGGGARGAYQVGALKALRERGHLENIHAISGASIGSINACLLAMGDLRQAADVWLTLDESKLLTVRDNLFRRFFEERTDFVRHGVYETDHLEEWLDSLLDYETIRRHSIYVATSYVGEEDANLFELMTLNLRNLFDKEGLIRYPLLSEMSDEHIRKTILASCAIPVFFRPVVIEKKSYYDGGVLDNTPYRPLVEAGCEEIIVIDLFRINFKRRREWEGVPLYNLYPRKHLRGVLDFSREQILRRFELGYAETIAQLESDPPFTDS